MRLTSWGCLAAPLLFAATALQAHGVRTDVRGTLEDPRISGITVELHQGEIAPQIVLENRSGRTLEILDAEGRAFLRIGPTGVEADVHSVEWRTSLNPLRKDSVAKARPPKWKIVRKQPSYGWFDSRLDTEPIQIPRPVVAVGKPVPLQDWRIAARFDGKPFELRGQFHYVPPVQGSVIAVLVTPQPLAPGVSLQLAPGDTPALLLQNRSRTSVRVLGTQKGVALEVPAGTNRSWMEPRLRYAGPLPANLKKTQTLGTWRLPLSIGSERVEVQGEHRWVPAAPVK